MDTTHAEAHRGFALDLFLRLGAWGDRFNARLHLDSWRRVLDREEPDDKT